MAPPAEISIPSTSIYAPDGSKPYTLYNITLRLPLRTFVVQKRYSDFSTLHQTLTSEAGSPPPNPLPGKSWFKSTVSSPELTESRRQGLESYLRAIAESPDRRWRDNQAWRGFLGLPNRGATSGAASAAGLSAASVRANSHATPNKDAANRAAAQDPGTWLDLHGEMKRDFQEARRALARRDQASDNGPAIEAGSQAKKALVKAGGILSALNDGLRSMGDEKRLGDGELRRRKDLLSAARVERDDLEKLCNTMPSAARQQQQQQQSSAAVVDSKKKSLFGNGPRAGGRVLGAPLPETERTRELDNQGVVQLQRQMMDEQDSDVNDLAKIIRRQREIAEHINREVEEQNEMIDHVHGQADILDGKVGVVKKRVKNIS